MTDLYELTRTFVRRGCPEPGTISYHDKKWCASARWLLMSQVGHVPVSESVARAIWTLWALEWFVSTVDDECILEHWNGPTRPTGNTEPGWDLQYMRHSDDSTGYDGFGPDILEAIEAATRHLEPSNEPA